MLSIYDIIPYTGGGCAVKIICGLGGAHSIVPRKCIELPSAPSASSGLIGQLFGRGNNYKTFMVDH